MSISKQPLMKINGKSLAAGPTSIVITYDDPTSSNCKARSF